MLFDDSYQGLIINKTYYVGSNIGSGELGGVHFCYHLRTEQKYAIKFIGSEFESNAKREKDIPMMVDSNRIMTVADTYDLIYNQELTYCIVYPYYDNCFSLSELLITQLSYKNHESPNFKFIANIGFQLAEGIKALHDVDIVHRDIKLDNILWCTDTIKIIDFDTAAIITPDSGYNVEHILDGTFEYMAPELASGKAQDYKLCDIYSYGVTMCLLFTKFKFQYDYKPKKQSVSEFLRSVRGWKCTTKVQPIDDYIARATNLYPDVRPTIVSAIKLFAGYC